MIGISGIVRRAGYYFGDAHWLLAIWCTAFGILGGISQAWIACHGFILINIWHGFDA